MRKREINRHSRDVDQDQPSASLRKDVSPAGAVSISVKRLGADGEDSKGDVGASDDFFKAVEKIPVVGPSLVFIIKKWGVPGLILFASGALFVLSLIAFGVLPERFVSEKYKKDAGRVEAPEATAPKTLPRSISFDRIEPTDDWILMLTDLLEREGADRQQANTRANYQFGVGTFQYLIDQRNEQFTLVIKANPNFKINGRAFRQTKNSFIQPLRFETDEQGISFVVPECEVGDKLILLLRAEGNGGVGFDNIRYTFSSSVRGKS